MSGPPGPDTSHPTQALNLTLKLPQAGAFTWKESGLYEALELPGRAGAQW